MTFANGESIEVTSCELDASNTVLTIELSTNDYNGVKALFKNSENLSTIENNGEEFSGYDTIISLTSRTSDLNGNDVVTVRLERRELKDTLVRIEQAIELVEGCIAELGDLIGSLTE